MICIADDSYTQGSGTTLDFSLDSSADSYTQSSGTTLDFSLTSTVTETATATKQSITLSPLSSGTTNTSSTTSVKQSITVTTLQGSTDGIQDVTADKTLIQIDPKTTQVTSIRTTTVTKQDILVSPKTSQTEAIQNLTVNKSQITVSPKQSIPKAVQDVVANLSSITLSPLEGFRGEVRGFGSKQEISINEKTSVIRVSSQTDWDNGTFTDTLYIDNLRLGGFEDDWEYSSLSDSDWQETDYGTFSNWELQSSIVRQGEKSLHGFPTSSGKMIDKTISSSSPSSITFYMRYDPESGSQGRQFLEFRKGGGWDSGTLVFNVELGANADDLRFNSLGNNEVVLKNGTVTQDTWHKIVLDIDWSNYTVDLTYDDTETWTGLDFENDEDYFDVLNILINSGSSSSAGADHYYGPIFYGASSGTWTSQIWDTSAKQPIENFEISASIDSNETVNATVYGYDSSGTQQNSTTFELQDGTHNYQSEVGFEATQYQVEFNLSVTDGDATHSPQVNAFSIYTFTTAKGITTSFAGGERENIQLTELQGKIESISNINANKQSIQINTLQGIVESIQNVLGDKTQITTSLLQGIGETIQNSLSDKQEVQIFTQTPKTDIISIADSDRTSILISFKEGTRTINFNLPTELIIESQDKDLDIESQDKKINIESQEKILSN